MSRVRLFHWDPSDAEKIADRLAAGGYEVVHGPFEQGTLRELRSDPPAAVVIDLDRLPSHGRDVGVALRTYKATRHVPLVFVGGLPEKVARIKDLLPDAVYTNWGRVRRSLKQAIAHPPANPVVHRSLLAGYAGTPLPKKLGIGEGTAVALVGAPRGFEKTLGEIPAGATVRRQTRSRVDLILWFTKSLTDLEREIVQMRERVGEGSLWIIWPKKASGVGTDLTQVQVRRAGLASGLVDYKVCAVDETWTGLKFAVRKANQAQGPTAGTIRSRHAGAGGRE